MWQTFEDVAPSLGLLGSGETLRVTPHRDLSVSVGLPLTGSVRPQSLSLSSFLFLFFSSHPGHGRKGLLHNILCAVLHPSP